MADAKQGKSPIEDFYNGSSQSRVVLAKPRLGGFGSSSFPSSSSKGCNPFGSVLRPPQLKASSNPFLKVAEADESEAGKDKTKDEVATEERLKDSKETDAPMFVPLGSSNVTPRAAVPAPQATTSSSSAGFVFGQNLSERVVMKESVNNGDATEDASVDHTSTNGNTELLFTSAAASVKENNTEESGSNEASSNSEGLAAAAAEYERSHARPPPPTTNCTFTGEEGEVNVLQISCRLFAWESGSWRERGRGMLRLNDAAGTDSTPGEAARGTLGEAARGTLGEAARGTLGGELKSGGEVTSGRLVVRVAGSLRVVLNTKLWPDMVVERAGTKSLRITATDAQHQIKLFLIMGAPGDIEQLSRALSARVAVSRRTAADGAHATSQQAAERLEAAADDEYSDKHTLPDDTHTDTTPDTTQQDSKALKRKEPTELETSPKRQCPEILIE